MAEKMDYLKLAQEAYDSSTSYIDANWRSNWDYALRAFNNEHAAGSKYLSEEYKARSRLFPPKTRTIIRKNEAAGMQAMFSNREVVNTEATNPDDPMSVASAAAMKEILEYRLDKSIPTFEIYIGGLQDAQTTGTVCSYQYWGYVKRDGKKIKDKPCIELRPIENIRFDSGASWLDPVGTSPYFCDIIPMYVCDVQAMMENKDDKTGSPKWKKFDEATIAKARPDVADATRRARLSGMQDPQDEHRPIKAFDIVWVMRWFMRDSQGYDKIFYTLGTQELLTEAVDLEKVYFHGVRPYAMGYAILEAHKTAKSGLPVLTRPLQQEATDITNQRMDNVRFVLNKRWLVARGRQVDVQSLVRNVPGGVTLLTDPKNDIVESNWPDVTSSAFVEHDRLNASFDDLSGNFSPSTKVANNAVNDTVRGSQMANQSAGMMTEYLLRTVHETWWEKVLRQLALLEQHYETDEIVLAVCAKKARLFPRFGISQITDDLLMQEVNITVNASMGNPQERLQKFLMATNAAIQLVTTAPPGFNIEEGIKEIYSNAGYRDGARFFGGQVDPRLAKAMQTIQQLTGILKGKQMELQMQGQLKQLEIQSNEKIKGAEIQVNAQRIQGELQSSAAERDMKKQIEGFLAEAKAHIEGKQADQQSGLKQLELQNAAAIAHENNERAIIVAQISAKSAMDTTLAAAEQKADEEFAGDMNPDDPKPATAPKSKPKPLETLLEVHNQAQQTSQAQQATIQAQLEHQSKMLMGILDALTADQVPERVDGKIVRVRKVPRAMQ